jgi:hypothetical protein
MKKGLLACAAFGLFLLGCGQDGGQPVAAQSQSDRLQSAAERLHSDPTASPEARKIAAGVLQQTQTQQQLNDFESGK